MRWSLAKRTLPVAITLLVLGLGVCGWQVVEHRRVEQAARQALINRGRDITSTLGVVVRSQRRIGIVISKERLETALQDLLRPGELEYIAILGATGDPIVSAGHVPDHAPEVVRSQGVQWRERTVTLMNLMDLGGTQPGEIGTRPPAAIVLADERLSRAFYPPARRPSEGKTAPPGEASAGAPKKAPQSASSGSTGTSGRPPFGKPQWMSQEEYEAILQKQGVHSLVVALSTENMHRLVRNDLLLRSLVSLLALAAVTVSILAWRNVAKTAELQIRLVKTTEANTHLKEMNLAAAGLAHETRNPLNLIRGRAHMIALSPKTDDALREHAHIIMEEADRVTVQLNEFINYSKPREAHLTPVECSSVVADVARTLLPDIEEKQVRLRLPEHPLMVRADEPLLRQALFNLILNAVQAVEVGGCVEVSHHLNPTGDEAELLVKDDGPGVPVSQRQAIFKPYVTMRPKGVGLGLAIVQQIMSAHGWDIRCEENAPKGAVFRISHIGVVSVS